MKLHRYLVDWNAVNAGGNSFVQYAKGQSYAITEETTRHVVQGFAEEIDVEISADDAAAAADKAAAKAAKAEQAAADAQMLADAAAQADAIAVAQAAQAAEAAEQPALAPEAVAQDPETPAL